jgi:hypothetical protein
LRPLNRGPTEQQTLSDQEPAPSQGETISFLDLLAVILSVLAIPAFAQTERNNPLGNNGRSSDNSTRIDHHAACRLGTVLGVIIANEAASHWSVQRAHDVWLDHYVGRTADHHQMLNVIAAYEHQTPLSVDDSGLYYRNSPLRFFAHFVAMQPVEHALSRAAELVGPQFSWRRESSLLDASFRRGGAFFARWRRIAVHLARVQRTSQLPPIAEDKLRTGLRS